MQNKYAGRMPTHILPTPSAEYLRSLFNYDPETGSLTWKERVLGGRGTNVSFNTRYAGQSVGTLNTTGSRQVRVKGRLVTAHRIIWRLMTNSDPVSQIDHINGNPDDNRWVNLREATQLENTWNQKVRNTNTSGHPCIYPAKSKRAASKKWNVRISLGKDGMFTATCYTFEEAKFVYEKVIAKHRDPRFRRVDP